jgi:1,4-alpha-glucan branching enzyme
MDAARLDLLRFLLLLEPAVPLFFQGEEAALDTPFPFFCDFAGELGEAVRRGRREEFRDLFHGTAEVPDPLDPATMESAKLAWDALTPTATAPFRDLVAHRERLVIPLLGTAYLGASTIREGAALVWRWRFASGTLCLAANLDTIAVDLDVTPTAGSVSVGERRLRRKRVEAGSVVGLRLGRAGVTGVSDWRATYRLQFHAGFTFDDALRVLPYLCRLGISHVYASPIQGARPGSTHGYDQVDPTCINPELGGELGFERFSDALRAAGLGLLVDIVPNHMAAHRTNPW